MSDATPAPVALVTGGARGIGAAVVRALTAAGCAVIIGDVLDTDGKALAEDVGATAAFVHLDVTDPDHWQAAVAAAERSFGPLSILVNNAGILAFGGVEQVSRESFRQVLDVNLGGQLNGIQAALPSLRRGHNPVVVNVSSTAGITGYAGIAAYVTSKWAIRGLTKAAALDLAPDGIRVVSVHPGPIATPMTAGMGDETVLAQPIPRFGRPEEVAALIRYLALEATFATGGEYLVDGGAVAGTVAPVAR